MINGKTLIGWGFDPKGRGKWFGSAIEGANILRRAGRDDAYIIASLKAEQPMPPPELSPRTNSLPISIFLEPENEIEQTNLNATVVAMDALMRVPVVKVGVIMPDACPAGVIPVGGVVASEAIHPGLHSADVCCSMAITVFKREMDLTKLLDVAQDITHFGPGGRKDIFSLPRGLSERIQRNKFLNDMQGTAVTHLGTQGDGNHFLFVGRLRSTGQPALVTHHGSRGVGAMLYKRGMLAAKRHTTIVSPRSDPRAAWIDGDSAEGVAYWEALQIVRLWTKENHFLLHDTIQQLIGNSVVDRFWNEHNFIFRKRDGLFYHAKGATPSFAGFSADDDGRTLIPLNLSEPILITRHRDKAEALGFSPHGAGRNMSRTQHIRLLGDADPQEIFERETKGLDIRAYLGTPDLSELPSAYKNAQQVVGQIEKHGLAEIEDYVDPYGSIMAGETPWQKKAPRSL